MSNIVLIDYTSTGHHISYSHTLIKGLKEKGHRVYVIGDSEWVGSCIGIVDDAFPVTLKLPPSGVFSREKRKKVFFSSCVAIAHKLSPDIIHFLYIDHFILAAVALRKRDNSTSIRATLHAGYMLPEFSSTLLGKIKGWVEFYFVRKLIACDFRIMVHSRALQQKMSQQMNATSIDFVPYPIETLKDVELESARKFIETHTGLSRQDRILLCFGDTRYDKGVDIAIQALSKLPADYHLLIAGKAEVYGELELRKLAYSLGVNERVHLHLHFIEDDQVPMYFRGADIVLVPYRKMFAGQSGPLMIAAAFGTPVVASNLLVLEETVDKYRLGALFEAENSDSLAHAIKEVDGFSLIDGGDLFFLDHDTEMFVSMVEKSYFQ